MTSPQITTLPRAPLDDDAIDKAARAVALEVSHHIEMMYPGAAEAVAWNSCKRSISGVVRNAMKRLGEAAEQGDLDRVISDMQKQRTAHKAAWRRAFTTHE